MRWRLFNTVGVVLLVSGSVSAQPRGGAPTPRPAFSPYLNLVRPGGSVTLNYYGLVRPEIQARQSIQNLQGSVMANQQAIGDIQAGSSELPVTGRGAGFLTHGSYFLTGGAGGGGAQSRAPGRR
jgi:hypothetical protein